MAKTAPDDRARLAALCGHLSPAQQSGLRSAPETGSAGRPPEQLLDTSALALGRTARAAVAGSHRDGLLAGRRGRAIVDIALGGDRCADTLGDDSLDDHDAFASFGAKPHLITGPYGMRGLNPYPVDPDVPGPAGTGRGRAGPGQPHRPDPAVHPPSLIACHSANCNARRARWLRPAWCLPRRAQRSLFRVEPPDRSDPVRPRRLVPDATRGPCPAGHVRPLPEGPPRCELDSGGATARLWMARDARAGQDDRRPR